MVLIIQKNLSKIHVQKVTCFSPNSMLLFCRALYLVVFLNLVYTKPALDDSIEHSVDTMEQVKFDYSLKNIPIPTQEEYKIELISSAEKFIKNLKWRVFHYVNPIPLNANLSKIHVQKVTCFSPNSMQKVTFLQILCRKLLAFLQIVYRK